MQKQVMLSDEIKNDKNEVIARMRVILNGDGSTPNIMTMGNSNPIGYEDDGTPIFPKTDDNLIKQRQKKMMAEAIKVQKQLTKENGIDPSVVNIIDAEKENK